MIKVFHFFSRSFFGKKRKQRDKTPVRYPCRLRSQLLGYRHDPIKRHCAVRGSPRQAVSTHRAEYLPASPPQPFSSAPTASGLRSLIVAYELHLQGILSNRLTRAERSQQKNMHLGWRRVFSVGTTSASTRQPVSASTRRSLQSLVFPSGMHAVYLFTRNCLFVFFLFKLILFWRQPVVAILEVPFHPWFLIFSQLLHSKMSICTMEGKEISLQIREDKGSGSKASAWGLGILAGSAGSSWD